jgi:hypothetical protein
MWLLVHVITFVGIDDYEVQALDMDNDTSILIIIWKLTYFNVIIYVLTRDVNGAGIERMVLYHSLPHSPLRGHFFLHPHPRGEISSSIPIPTDPHSINRSPRT